MSLLNVRNKILDPALVTESESRVFVESIVAPTGCQTLAYEIGVDVPPADQTFLSGEPSTLTTQGITLTAVERGEDGDDITIAFTNPVGVVASEVVSVAGTDISVELKGSAAVAATGTATITDFANLLVGTPDTIEVAGVVFTAQAGAATPGDATFQAATDNDATAASLATQVDAHATSGPLVNCSVAGAVVTITAVTAGTGGNSLTLVYTDNGSEIGATVSGSGTLAGGANLSVTSTVTSVRTAINADMDAADLVTASGTSGSAVAAAAAVPLTGGVNSDVNVDDNEVSVPNHGYLTGQEVELSSDGTLPAPLVAATAYFIIKLNNSAIQFAASLEDAEAGDPIVLEDQGSSGAENTIDVETIVDGSLQLQKSLGGESNDPDDWTWFNEGSPIAVSADGPVYIEKVDPTAAYYGILVSFDEGQMALSGRFLGKGPVD